MQKFPELFQKLKELQRLSLSLSTNSEVGISKFGSVSLKTGWTEASYPVLSGAIFYLKKKKKEGVKNKNNNLKMISSYGFINFTTINYSNFAVNHCKQLTKTTFENSAQFLTEKL